MARFDPFSVAANLVDCVCAYLKSEDRDEEDRWDGDCCVYPGGSTAPSLPTNCCEGKFLLTVAVTNGFPTESFPTQSSRAPECGHSLLSMATVYEIKATRCVGIPGLECGCDCREKNANRLLGDLQAMLQGIACCFEPSGSDDCARYVLNSWRLLENNGGCSGVTATITAESDAICCPPDAEPAAVVQP